MPVTLLDYIKENSDKNDLRDVAFQIGKSIEELNFTFGSLELSFYKLHVLEVYSFYEEYNIDKKKVDKIKEILSQGEPIYPPFIREGTHYILQGRHRVVALYELGIKAMPVFYVS